MNENGEWISDPTTLETLAQDFFKPIFRKEGPPTESNVASNGFLSLSEDLEQVIHKPFTKDQIKKALFDMVGTCSAASS